MKNIQQNIKVILLGVIVAIGAGYAYAWTGPTAAPPNGNVAAPINTGSSAQIKLGSLVLNGSTTAQWLTGLTVFGQTIFNGPIQIADGSQGTGKVLTSDANGNATWTAASTSATNINANSVISTSTAIVTSTSWTDIGVDVTVTPTSAASKFLINADVIGMNGSSAGNCDIGLFRNTTAALAAPYASYEGGSWDAFPVGITYIDSISGISPVSYEVMVKPVGGGKCYVNESQGDASFTGASTMSVLQIK